MQQFQVDAIGEKIYLNFGRDISSATILTMKIQPEVGDDIDVTPTLETSNAWVDDQQMIANKFVSYTTTDGMFDNYKGRYRIKGTAKAGSTTYSTDWVLIQVND